MRGLKKHVEQTNQANPMNDCFIGTTNDGCFIDVKQGVERVRLEPPMDQALDMAASMVVACLPTALRSGYTVESFMEAFAERIAERTQEAMATATAKGEAS
jgi:hypothetical protein